jgi:hypothetical protein
MARLGWLWVAGWFAVSSVWCVGAGQHLGPTFDEPFYVAAGLKAWHTGKAKYLVSAGTMPLPPLVATLPLVAMESLLSPSDHSDHFSIDDLKVARLATLSFWFLLLLAGYLGGRLWAGEIAGWLAVAFLAVEPILLGHASLATTDLPFTSCLVSLIVAFKAGQGAKWSRRVLIPAALCAMTMLAKASAVVFVPVCLFAVICERRDWRRGLLDLLQVFVVGAALALIISPRAWTALDFQIRHNEAGHGDIFLFGQVSSTGFWYYFPAAFAVKTSLAMLLLLCLCATRPRHLWNAPILAAIGLLLVSPLFHVQIGIRFLLPAVALSILGLAIAAGRWIAESRSPGFRGLTWGVVTVALVWTGAQAVLVWPNGICYTNELFGGTANGYLVLSDSNYDWGQGLPELARWQRAHVPAPVDVWYFGTDPRVEQMPFRPVDAGSATSLADLRERYGGRYLAVSTSLLYGTGFATPGAIVLRGLVPTDRTRTFLIYDFSRDGASESVKRSPNAAEPDAPPAP